MLPQSADFLPRCSVAGNVTMRSPVAASDGRWRHGRHCVFAVRAKQMSPNHQIKPFANTSHDGRLLPSAGLHCTLFPRVGVFYIVRQKHLEWNLTCVRERQGLSGISCVGGHRRVTARPSSLKSPWVFRLIMTSRICKRRPWLASSRNFSRGPALPPAWNYNARSCNRLR